jgi:hypothetical protein
MAAWFAMTEGNKDMSHDSVIQTVKRAIEIAAMIDSQTGGDIYCNWIRSDVQ